MVDEQIQVPGGELFDLEALFSRLVRFSDRRLRNIGCFKSNECAEDVATTYVFENKLWGEGRTEILGEKIRINFPNAKNQMSVLYANIRFAIRNKRTNCQDCPLRVFCPIAEELEADDDDRQPTSQFLIEPTTPEDTLREKELFLLCLKALQKPERRKAFILYHYLGFSHKDIARKLKVSASRVRQWYSRDLKTLRRFLALAGEPQAESQTSDHHSQEAIKSLKGHPRAIISNMLASVSLSNVTNLNASKSKH